MYPTTTTIVTGYVLILFTALIYLPIALYGLYKTYQHREQEFIRSRIAVLSFQAVITFLMLVFSVKNGLQIVFYDRKPGFVLFMRFITVPLGLLALWTLFYCLVLKYWMLLFSVKYAMYNAESKWRSIIDGKYKSDVNFYIRHHSTLGNKHYVQRRARFAASIGAIFDITVHFMMVKNLIFVFCFVRKMSAKNTINIAGNLALYAR
jgi:hypothetical protein